MTIAPVPPDRYITLGDINTRYWSLGNQGKPVILLHGLGSCVETWTYTIGALAHSHRVYAVDLVGCGRSDKPSITYSLVEQAHFIKTFIDTFNLNRVSLVGNSMGGGVGLQFALLFPEAVEKLVLVDSLGLGQEINLILRLASLPFVKPLFQPSRIGTAFFLKQVVYDASIITDDWVNVFYQIYTLPGAPEALQSQVKSLIDFWGVHSEVYRQIVDHLALINTPTLVVWGQQDPVLPVAHAQVAANLLQNAQLHILGQCGHWAQVERPKEFNSLVVEFLL
ncbi:MAG TPA: alpha/beta fold hydrolase [Candidatus Caenarcaniphilales bacterium]